MTLQELALLGVRGMKIDRERKDRMDQICRKILVNEGTVAEVIHSVNTLREELGEEPKAESTLSSVQVQRLIDISWLKHLCGRK